MILIVFLLSLLAQTSSTPKPAEYGSIEGVVVDPQGKPVEGAFVYAASDNYPPMSRPYTTTTKANGEFVLDQIIPDRKIDIHAYKDSDFYADVLAAFSVPPKWEMPEVEVRPGQTVTGVTVRLMPKAAKLRLNVHDADTKELIPWIGYQFCREDHPTYCVGGGGLSDRERFMPVGVGISIKIEADDGLHEKWEYRNLETRSPYFRAKSGETEVMDVFLRKKDAEPPELDFIHFQNEALEPPSPNRWDLRSLGELREGVILTPNEVRWTPELEYTYPTTDITLYEPGWGGIIMLFCRGSHRHNPSGKISSGSGV